jgi:hypothetical protein
VRRAGHGDSHRGGERPAHIDLVKGSVPDADREKSCNRVRAEDLVSLGAHELEALLRRHRHGRDDSRGTGCSRPAESPIVPPGGEAVVDDDRCPVSQIERTVRDVQLPDEERSSCLGFLDGRCDLLVGEPVPSADVDAVARRDGPDPVLRLPLSISRHHGAH